MEIFQYAEGRATGSDPETWDNFETVRRWFAGLPPGARVFWTDHASQGLWVVDWADVVVPAIEDVVAFKWLWTVDLRRFDDPGAWRLEIQPNRTLWQLFIGGSAGYVTDSRPEEVTAGDLSPAREESNQGPEEWREIPAISHDLINRVQQEWVARHCGRPDVVFAFDADLQGQFARMLIERMSE